MAQIKPIVSESLEAQIRNLLPSQNGFTEDLQAQNVIVPVIDLTSAAEGSSTPQNLQTALAFGSQTAFSIQNQTTVIVNNTGFYRIFGVVSIRNVNGADQTASFTMSDGLSSKTIWQMYSDQGTSGVITEQFDFVVFIASGESISGVASSSEMRIVGSSRQIANVNGRLVNPSGFFPQ